jgi:hypothetical protein
MCENPFALMIKGAQTVPLSITRVEEIATLRDWANTRAVPASARDASPATA